MTLCLWMSGCWVWRCVSGWVVVGYDAVSLSEWLLDMTLSLGEWLLDMTLCLWVRGCGIWRYVSGWVVVGCDAVSLGEWFLDVTLCPLVSGCGIWRCVSGWVVVGYDAVSLGEWLLDMTLCHWVSGFQSLEWKACLLLHAKMAPQERWEPMTLLALHVRIPESSETTLWGKSRLPSLVSRKQIFIFTATFWVVTPCFLADIYRRFAGKHGRYLPGW